MRTWTFVYAGGMCHGIWQIPMTIRTSRKVGNNWHERVYNLANWIELPSAMKIEYARVVAMQQLRNGSRNISPPGFLVLFRSMRALDII